MKLNPDCIRDILFAIEEKTSIKYSKKQMLVALSYGKNHVTSLPIKGLETNKKIKNDYTCILSIKFK